MVGVWGAPRKPQLIGPTNAAVNHHRSNHGLGHVNSHPRVRTTNLTLDKRSEDTLDVTQHPAGFRHPFVGQDEV